MKEGGEKKRASINGLLKAMTTKRQRPIYDEGADLYLEVHKACECAASCPLPRHRILDGDRAAL